MKKIFTLGLMLLTASVMFGQAMRTIDFEFEGLGGDWTWTVGENGENSPPLEIIENPDYEDANESQTVAKFTAKADGQSWALIVNKDDNGEFTFDADNCIIKMMVNKPIASDIGFKVEGGTGTVTTKVQANTLVNEWQEISFDFTEVIGQTFSAFVIMPSLVSRSEDVVAYLDNIQMPGGPASSVGAVDADILGLYPNPTSDVVTLLNVPNGAMVNVHNITGALVKSVAVGNGVVSLEDLAKGVYFVSVNGATTKVVKN